MCNDHFLKGVEFHYENKGANIPPPRDRVPSMGPAKEMPTGPLIQSMDPEDYDDPAAADYVNDLADGGEEHGVSITAQFPNSFCFESHSGGLRWRGLLTPLLLHYAKIDLAPFFKN